MTLSVKQGTFTKSTSTSVPVTQNITGLGFTPKAIWMWTEAGTSTGFSDQWLMSYGFSDGSANGCISGAAKKVIAANSLTGGTIRDDSCICILDAAGTPTNVLARGKVTGFSSGQVSFQWDANTAVASIVHYMVIGGTDITNVKVLSTTMGTTSTGNKGYTGVGFVPDFAQAINGAVGQTTINATSSGWIWSLGTAISTSARWVMGGHSENNVSANNDTYTFKESAKFLASWATTNAAVDMLADFVSFDSDGLTVNYSDAPGSSSQRIIFLCIKGGLWDIGNFTKKTSTGTQDVSITAGRDPEGLQLFSCNDTVTSSSAAGESHNRLSIGGSDGTTEGTIWAGDQDNIQNTVSKGTKTDKCILLATENTTSSSSTVNGEADINFMNSSKFQLNWTTANATAYVIFYWTVSITQPSTKLYFHDTTSGIPSGTLPSAEQSSKTVTSGCNFEGSQTTNRLMNTTIGTTQASLAANTFDAALDTWYVSRWVSPVINETSIPAGDWTYNFAAKESATTANFPVTGSSKAVAINCYIWKPSNGTKYGTILDGDTTAATYSEPSVANTETSEHGTFTGAAISSLTSTDACIVFEAWFVCQAASFPLTQTFYYDGTVETSNTGTTVSDHAAYITIPASITFVSLAQVNQSFTHLYKIVGRTNQTYTHKYKIVGRVAQTYTHKYKLRSLIAQTFTHLYKLRKLATQSFTHKYKIIGRIAQTFTHKYKLRQLATQSFTHLYKLRALATQTYTHKYKIRTLVANTYTHLYKIVGRATQQFTHRYNILILATKTYTFKYNILGRVAQVYTHLYKIIGRVAQTYTHKYKIAQLASQTFTHKYKIRGLVTQTFTHIYKISSSILTATASFTHKYKIVGRTNQIFTFKYNIANLATQSFTHKYKIRILASQIFTHKYKLRQLATQAFHHRYNIAILASQVFTHKYNIIGRVNQIFTHRYKLRQLSGQKSFTHIYKIRQLTSQTFTHRYNIAQLASQIYTFKYNILGRVSQTFTHIYNILVLVTAVSNTFTFKYKIVGRVSQTYTHVYNVAKAFDFIPLWKQSTVRKIESGFNAFKNRDRFRMSESYLRQLGNRAVRKYLIRSRKTG